ncbi:MAG: DNA mismatch repair protein MutS [Patescibacteria group bacterium]|nr:MAG: DNA mismatch repair protein MutS [Patescibacteria group bacterium]
MAKQQGLTPMMKQYLRIKKKYPNHLVMFRLGDFYEFFYEDAKKVSKILNITLTSRSKRSDQKIPMAGIPYHSVENYLKKLISHQYRVVVCEELTEADGKNLVERDVVKILTPGNLNAYLSDSDDQLSYIISFAYNGKRIAYCYADVSTGEFVFNETAEVSLVDKAVELVKTLPVSEVVFLSKDKIALEIETAIKKHRQVHTHFYQPEYLNLESSESFVKNHFKVASLKVFGLESGSLSLDVCAGLLDYLIYAEKNSLAQITTIKKETESKYLAVDFATLYNLDVFDHYKYQSQTSSLFNLFNHCKTAGGKRRLQKWFLQPLADQNLIEQRLNAVEKFFNDQKLSESTADRLSQIYDVERILTRVVNNKFNLDDLVNLKTSIVNALELKNLLGKEQKIFGSLTKVIDGSLIDLASSIEETVIDNALERSDTNKIKSGVSKQLDELKNLLENTQQIIAEMETEERNKTKIPTLKIGYNKVFGFYIEVSKSYQEKVPDDYIRKQTLVNSERYISSRLKELEDQILTAEQKIMQLEAEIIQQLKDKVLKNLVPLQILAESVSEIDCLHNLSQIAFENDYVRPRFSDSNKLKIIDGRHPIVEKTQSDKLFSPNDTIMNKKDSQILVLTGPNMAGKSVYIRQSALIAYLAQIGSFVPAKTAVLPVFDRLCVRSGAGDIISEGISTFMLEMIEASKILHSITDRSFVVLDEIGRGTSTYDGISIAWAIAEYLSETPGKQAFTLFATHYHELQDLETKYKNIKNYQMAIKLQDGKPVFLYKVIRGASSHSFGIYAAEMANMPVEVIQSAKHVLKILESKTKKISVKKIVISQPALFSSSYSNKIIDKLRQLDPDAISPKQALDILYNLVRLAKKQSS